MKQALLTSKTHCPIPPQWLIRRHRLIGMLNEGYHSGRLLSLVSAPAGSGKTSLVSEWIQVEQLPACWLSLDSGDSDARTLLSYIVACLQTRYPDFGASTLTSIEAGQGFAIKTALTRLLNDLSALPERCLVVLDDWHSLDSIEANQILSFLVNHAPSSIHLVITCREDPDLPLSRLRARAQVTEVRGVNLRFSMDEAAVFLEQTMGLNLTREQVKALEARTEGWIAGLQLAALSLKGKQDIEGFVSSFTGSNRFVLDYLADEVLSSMKPGLREFMLDCSILDRFCVPLCEVVTGHTGVRALLDNLERENLFLIALDDNRDWYRFHHLFADVLRIHARYERISIQAKLHMRASLWFEGEHMAADAIRHALAALDYDRAAILIEAEWPEMNTSFRSAVWLDWIERIPENIVRSRSTLCFQRAQSHLDMGQADKAEVWLRATEVHAAKDTTVDLQAHIALGYANVAQIRGDASSAVKYAEIALNLTAGGNAGIHMEANAMLSIAAWMQGQLSTAQARLRDWIHDCVACGKRMFALVSAAYLAEVMALQGKLGEAMVLCETWLRKTSELGAEAAGLSAPLHLMAGLIYLERANFADAERHHLKAIELGKQTTLVDWPSRLHSARARFAEARGDYTLALDAVDEAETTYIPNPVPLLQPFAARRAQILLRQGLLADAGRWIRSFETVADNPPGFLVEFQQLVRLRYQLASGQPAEPVLRRLDACEISAEEGGRLGSRIAILVLKSIGAQKAGDQGLARDFLSSALTLGEGEGYVRIFAEEGDSIAGILRAIRSQRYLVDFIDTIFAEIARSAARYAPADPPSNRMGTAGPSSSVPTLSKREQEILNLLSTGYSNQQICQTLFVALDTVKGHNRNIFEKLGAKNRTEAVARARSFGLIA